MPTPDSGQICWGSASSLRFITLRIVLNGELLLLVRSAWRLGPRAHPYLIGLQTNLS